MQTPLRLFPHEGETIEGVGAALRAGKTTCAAVLEHCFHQIDLWEEKVRAWVVVDRAGAMHQARALDAELASGRCRGPLHGIPIGVKDIIDVQGLPTAAGFKPWRERVAGQDADVVARLRRAGAVILGKTVTTQFAWIDPPVTRNPWNLDRTPGGSSSGSAAAVATGMCLGALGTQTGGSIIRPASFCGVAGLKPPHGMISADGIVPLSPSLDHPGPIARTTGDLRLIFDALDLYDERQSIDAALYLPLEEIGADVETRLSPRTTPPTLLRPRGFFDRRSDPVMLDQFERSLAALAAAGARIIDLNDDAIDFEGILTRHRLIMAAEAAAGHESRYAENREAYAPQISTLVEEGLAIPATAYVRCHQDWQNEPAIEDLVVTPATVGPAPDRTTTGNPCFNSPFSYLQWPTVSFPIGLSPEGLPLAIQLAKSFYTDESLFETARWCESVLRRASLAGSR